MNETVTHYDYDTYCEDALLALGHPLPRTEADLAREAENPDHAHQDLIKDFASLPTPHFPIGRYYVRQRLQDLSAEQVYHLQAYHAHLNEEDLLHQAALVQLGLTGGDGRLQATNRASLLAKPPTHYQLEAARAAGRNLKAFLRSRPDFTLELTPAGDVVYRAGVPVRNAHTDLKGDNFGFGRPLNRWRLRKWNRIKDRKLSTCPGLIEQLEATHNSSFPPHTVLIIWPADLLCSFAKE